MPLGLKRERFVNEARPVMRMCSKLAETAARSIHSGGIPSKKLLHVSLLTAVGLDPLFAQIWVGDACLTRVGSGTVNCG